jgi:hypothetical protein
MGRNGLIIAVVLIAFLAVALGYSYHVWTSVGVQAAGAGGTMDRNGYTALIIGAIGSFVLGGGLMALVFFSSRRGYDDAADLKSRPDADR